LRGLLPAARACLARATNPGLPPKLPPTVTPGPSGTVRARARYGHGHVYGETSNFRDTP
jgi:hypothetical protein